MTTTTHATRARAPQDQHAPLAWLLLLPIGLLSTLAPDRMSSVQAAPNLLPSSCATSTTHLENPDTAEAWSANSWVAQHTVHPGTAVTIYSGAYDQKISSGPPAVSAIQVLDDRFQKVPGGTWNLSSINQANTPPVNPDCTQPGTKSTLYEYTGTWIAPEKTALYYLAVTFTFADGTQVEFFTNMRVVASSTPLPQMHTLWYDTGALAGLPAQNTFNSAYNIFAAGTTAHMESRYYFDGNPAATPNPADPTQSTSSLASTLRSINLSQPPVFENVFNSSSGAPIALPYLASGQTTATRQFAYASYDSVTNDLDVPQSGTITVAQQPTTIGSHLFSYVVVVDEPFAVHSGGKANATVGSYILDNGFTGPVADGQGSQGDNLGEGRFFAFYSNPGPPLPSQPDTTHLRFTWTPPDPTSLGNGTTVTYIFSVVDLTATKMTSQFVERTYRLSGITQDVPGAVGDTFVVPGHQYAATVQAVFTFSDGSKLDSSSIDGPPITTNAGSVATDTPTVPTDTPLPTASPTDTPVPTQTPTPTQSDTPTPTDTPTPVRGSASLSLDPQPGVYGWIHTLAADDALARDAYYATTWANPRPGHFSWQAGRPLHLVPALSGDPALSRPLLHPCSSATAPTAVAPAASAWANTASGSATVRMTRTAMRLAGVGLESASSCTQNSAPPMASCATITPPPSSSRRYRSTAPKAAV